MYNGFDSTLYTAKYINTTDLDVKRRRALALIQDLVPDLMHRTKNRALALRPQSLQSVFDDLSVHVLHVVRQIIYGGPAKRTHNTRSVNKFEIFASADNKRLCTYYWTTMQGISMKTTQ